MGQTKQARGLASLSRATDTLSTLLAQQVRELNARQKAAKKEGTSGAGTMKDLKEATAVLKDLAAVSSLRPLMVLPSAAPVFFAAFWRAFSSRTSCASRVLRVSVARLRLSSPLACFICPMV